MMDQSIFYAWQSDLPAGRHRSFIKDSLKKAIKNLHRNYDLYEPPRLEESGSSEPGWPDISATILTQIENCRAFVADMSIVNQRCACEPETRPTPNPNVLFELGYARAVLGHRSIICVVNLASLRTGKLEELPFDVRGKRPVVYTYAEGDDKASERHELAGKLEMALAAIFTQTAEGPAMDKWADGDERFTIRYKTRDQNGNWLHEFNVPFTWNELFAATALGMLHGSTLEAIRGDLSDIIREKAFVQGDIDVSREDVDRVVVQFRALKLIERSGPGLWNLTEYGENRLIEMRARPKKKA